MAHHRGARETVGRALRQVGLGRSAAPGAQAEPEPAGHDSVDPLLASGLFDPWYYALQAGRALGDEPSAEEAAGHYLREGAAQGLLPNPLTDVRATGLGPDEIVAGLLDGSARLWPVRGLLDAVALVELEPGAAEHRGGPVGLYLELAHRGALVPRLAGLTWAELVDLRERQAPMVNRLRRDGVLDRAYYEAQVGRPFLSDTAAAWHYLEDGEDAGLSPHPLFEPEWYRSATGVTGPAYAHFLRFGRGPGGPQFDSETYRARHPEAAQHRRGLLVHYLEGSDVDSPTVPAEGGPVAATTWGGLAATMQAAAEAYGRQQQLMAPAPTLVARWALVAASPDADARTSDDEDDLETEDLPEGAAAPEPVADEDLPAVAILADGREWNELVPQPFGSVLAQEHRRWTMRVAVDDGRRLPPGLATAAASDDRIVLVATSHDSWGERANDLLDTVEEPFVAFWHVRERWSPELLARLTTEATSQGAYAAVVENPLEPDPTWYQELPDQEALLWQRSRGFAGMVLSASVLRSGSRPFRSAAEDQYAWDWLLRHGLDATYSPFVGVRGKRIAEMPHPPGRDSTVVEVLRAERILDWDAVSERVGDRTPGRLSLLIPNFRDWDMARAAIESALAHGDGDLEVVLLDNGSARAVTSCLAAYFAADPRVRIVRAARNTNFATGSNLAFAASTGEHVVFLNNDTLAHPGWTEPLRDALGRDDVVGAQPLLLYADGSIQTAGTVFYGPHAVAGHFLASHPMEDLREQIDLRFRAVTAACMAVRADDVAACRGFDPAYVNGFEDVDLCLRLSERRPHGDFVVVRESRVTHLESKTPGRGAHIEPNRLRFLQRWGHLLPGPETTAWEQAGFEVVGEQAGGGLAASRRRTSLGFVLRRAPRLVPDGPAAGLPSLRWAIKISAPGGEAGDRWGDTAFAHDLASGLRSLGQEVVIDRMDAHERPRSDYLDDVTLRLQGLGLSGPQPGATNVLWVISHPDEVTPAVVDSGFELVYAAGAPWAEAMSARTRTPVRTLLQATDPGRFSPDGPRLGTFDVLFVGRTRNVFRPIVRDTLEVGADLTVFGSGWDEYIHDDHVHAHHLPNADLPAAYRSARIVLNDHWDDMAAGGFFSNRLFDAAACGVAVVSDPVPGLEKVFGSVVRAYRSTDELAELLAPGSTEWADADRLAADAATVAAEHSFVRRAQRLLGDVLTVRGVSHDLG